jgi:hypothetical protein
VAQIVKSLWVFLFLKTWSAAALGCAALFSSLNFKG